MLEFYLNSQYSQDILNLYCAPELLNLSHTGDLCKQKATLEAARMSIKAPKYGDMFIL